MNHKATYAPGVFHAQTTGIRKKDGRYCLSLIISDSNLSISIDIHDSLYETLGTSNFDKELIKKIFFEFPRTIIVSNLKGYWQIQNESQIFSDVLSKII